VLKPSDVVHPHLTKLVLLKVLIYPFSRIWLSATLWTSILHAIEHWFFQQF